MKYVTVLLLITGLFFFFFGLKFLLHTIQFKKNAIKTMGTVIEVKTSTGRTTSITYSPVLEFVTLNGETHIYDVSKFNYTKYKLGDKIEIIYLKNDPKNVNINTSYDIFITPIAVLLLGIICIIAALIIYFKYRQ